MRKGVEERKINRIYLTSNARPTPAGKEREGKEDQLAITVWWGGGVDGRDSPYYPSPNTNIPRKQTDLRKTRSTCYLCAGVETMKETHLTSQKDRDLQGKRIQRRRGSTSYSYAVRRGGTRSTKQTHLTAQINQTKTCKSKNKAKTNISSRLLDNLDSRSIPRPSPNSPELQVLTFPLRSLRWRSRRDLHPLPHPRRQHRQLPPPPPTDRRDKTPRR